MKIHGVGVNSERAGLLVLLFALAGCQQDGVDDPAKDPAQGKSTAKRPVNRRAVEAEIAATPGLNRPQIADRWPLYRDWTMREVAIDSLARIGPAAVPALVEALHAPDPLLRRQAAQALARIGPDARDAVPDLMAALQDGDEEVRKNAARAIGQVGPEARAAVPRLLEELTTETSGDAGA